VANFLEATSQLSQTTLRAVLGKHELDELLAERERLNLDIQKTLAAQTDAWGIKVTIVEIKHVDLEGSMVRAIARQAEAERERRAKVIHAEGELQASHKLAEAAEILAAANVKFRPSTIGTWARTGKLQSIKLGGRRFVRRGEVRALIAPPRRVRADHLQPGLFEDLRD